MLFPSQNFLRHQSVSGAPPPKKILDSPRCEIREKRETKKLSLCQWTHNR